MDSPQIPHRDAELLRYLHLRRAGPMEAIPVGVPPGQLSRSLANPVCQFLDFCYGRHRSKSSFNGLEGKDSSENRNLIRSRSDATSAGSQSSLERGRRTTKSVRLQHGSVVSGLNSLRPSSNRDDHRFAQVLTDQQAVSVFRQAKTGGQFGHVTRELSDLDFT